MNRYEHGITSLGYKSLDKKSSGSGVKSKIMPNQEITKGLDDQIIKKFEKSKVYSSFRDNILAADIVDMQLISKYDE